MRDPDEPTTPLGLADELSEPSEGGCPRCSEWYGCCGDDPTRALFASAIRFVEAFTLTEENKHVPVPDREVRLRDAAISYIEARAKFIGKVDA